MEKIKVSVLKMFGLKDYNIEIIKRVPIILHADNGVGKTTFLTILASILQTGNNTFSSGYISGKFEEAKVITETDELITKEFIIKDASTLDYIRSYTVNTGPFSFKKFLRKQIQVEEERRITKRVIIYKNVFESIENQRIVSKAYFKEMIDNISSEILIEFYNYMMQTGIDDDFISEAYMDFPNIQDKINLERELINNNFHTIFLPVSRQLETKNYNITGYENLDIEKKLNDISREIKDLVNKANNQTFTNVFKYLSSHDSSLEDQIDTNEMLDVLNFRLKDHINETIREEIAQSVLEPNNERKFIMKELLTSIHNQLKEEVLPLERKLLKFIEVCNTFLRGKRFQYYASTNEVKLVFNNTEVVLPIHELSSGELHLITIFMQVFLEIDENKQLLIIIDEPELSLSIEWQKKFLSTLLKSDNVFSIIAATHSPFILGERVTDDEFEFSNYLMHLDGVSSYE